MCIGFRWLIVAKKIKNKPSSSQVAMKRYHIVERETFWCSLPLSSKSRLNTLSPTLLQASMNVSNLNPLFLYM